MITPTTHHAFPSAARFLALVLLTVSAAGCARLPRSTDTDRTPASAAAILDVFPPSTVELPAAQRGRTELSAVYTPTESLWGEHLREETVFQFEIRHFQDPANSFRARLGKGGQLYSLRGAFGESIPPQGRGHPWNDEVWQFVSVCSKYDGVRDLPPESAERLANSPYATSYFIHNSGAYMPSLLDQGVITLSCDVMLDRETPGILNVILRDPAVTTFGTLQVNAGQVTFNNVTVAPATPGVWQRMTVTFALGADSPAEARVTVGPLDSRQPTTTMTVPFAAAGISTFSWLALSGGGEEAGVIHVDNLSVRRVRDGQVEWPIREDYEDYAVLDVHEMDETTGAAVAVTDRVAATGRRSLEIRDAAGLEYDWLPLVRYGPQTTSAGNLYCPLLAEDVPDDGRTYRSVNWGLVPQLKTVHRSPILYYVQTRDLGDGIIEVTYVVHNFSVREDVVFDWLNAPWGGTRLSSLPLHYLASPSGELRDRDWLVKEMETRGGAIGVRETGGWNLSSAGETADSPSLALVFGRDKHLETELNKAEQGLPPFQLAGSIYRHMLTPQPEDWLTRPGNSWRNYEVAVVIPRLNLAPGKTIWYRSYLVVNRRDRAIAQAQSLVDQVDYGQLTFDPATTPRVPVAIHRGKVVKPQWLARPSFELFAQPVPGTLPLFLVENATTGQEVVTTDPYLLVPQEKLDFDMPPDHPQHEYYQDAVGYSLDENNTHWKRLLGYGYVNPPPGNDAYRPLSELLDPALFPSPTTYHRDLWVKPVR